ncbi:D-2-hydroxyacid dehydrogenase [Helicobacter pametensis]|uniref:D-2-hydroxyacid dehydrogenase n=1 Tax=Helicobacter pametensis TaxID=95149 RepID=UPI0004815C6B|nr:D-2-hydroxyacid dehydrogenase [Helicobacter pametensis]
MKLVILDTLTLGDVNLEQFKDFGLVETYATTKENEILERCKEADIIITCKVRFSAEILQSLPNLKLIALTSTGMDIIDLEAAKSLGIQVKNVVGYSTFAVAQHALMLALALLGNLASYDGYCKNGKWCDSPIFTHITHGLHELHSKQWGIIGLGNIGKQTAKLAQAFGAEVSYTSTSGANTNSEYPQKSLQELLSSSDIISIHAPLNTSTYHLLNQANLKLLKDHALLINVGRGGIIDEEALALRMQESQIKFGSDVLEKEPMMANHPLLNPSIQDRLLLTPHTAWAYTETRERLIQKVYENIQTFLNQK